MSGPGRLWRRRCRRYQRGDPARMPLDCSRVRRRMATILGGGIACLIGPSRNRLRRSKIRSSFAMIGRSGIHRWGGFSTANRGRGCASGRRRRQHDMTGPRRVLRWRRGVDDPERLIIVGPVAMRDDTDDRDSQRAGRRSPKRKASSPRRLCGIEICIRAVRTRTRKSGLPEHSNTLQAVSPGPSIHYVHLPSPYGLLIEMSRGSACSPTVPPLQWGAVHQLLYPKPLTYENARHLPGRSGLVTESPPGVPFAIPRRLATTDEERASTVPDGSNPMKW